MLIFKNFLKNPPMSLLQTKCGHEAWGSQSWIQNTVFLRMLWACKRSSQSLSARRCFLNEQVASCMPTSEVRRILIFHAAGKISKNFHSSITTWCKCVIKHCPLQDSGRNAFYLFYFFKTREKVFPDSLLNSRISKK